MTFDKTAFFMDINNIGTNDRIQFHNYIRSQIKTHYHEDIITETEKKILEKYDQYLHVNSFLMLYSYLEGELYSISKHNDVEPTPKINSIIKYEPLINAFSLSKSKEWNNIKVAVKIRDTFLHCDGIIDASRNRTAINQLLSKSDPTIHSIEGRLVLSPSFLHGFANTVKFIKSKVYRKKSK